MTILARHRGVDSNAKLLVAATDCSGNAWQTEVVFESTLNTHLLTVWGRAKVRELEDRYTIDRYFDAEARERVIVDTSLETKVLSRFTAFVAVDTSTVVNPDGQPIQIVQPVE